MLLIVIGWIPNNSHCINLFCIKDMSIYTLLINCNMYNLIRMNHTENPPNVLSTMNKLVPLQKSERHIHAL